MDLLDRDQLVSVRFVQWSCATIAALTGIVGGLMLLHGAWGATAVFGVQAVLFAMGWAAARDAARRGADVLDRRQARSRGR